MPTIGAPELIILFIVGLIPIVLGGVVCDRKGQPVWLGIVLGFLLSWLGLIIVLFLPRHGK